MNESQMVLNGGGAALFLKWLWEMILAYWPKTEPIPFAPAPVAPPVVQILKPDPIEVPFMPAPIQPTVDPRIALLEQLYAFIDALEAAGNTAAADKARLIWTDLAPVAKKPE